MIAIIKTCGQFIFILIAISGLLSIFSLVSVFVLGLLIVISFGFFLARQYSLIIETNK